MLLFFASLLLCTCSKDEVLIFEPGDMEFGYAKALKNEHDWMASVYGFQYDMPNDSHFFMHFNTYLSGIYLRESLIIGKIPKAKGTYSIIKTSMNDTYSDKAIASYDISEDDGDVAGDSYFVDEDANHNKVEVTYIDTIAGIVRGKFSVTFLIKEPKKNSQNSDCVQFTDGEFEATFQ